VPITETTSADARRLGGNKPQGSIPPIKDSFKKIETKMMSSTGLGGIGQKSQENIESIFTSGNFNNTMASSK
jgi:hypothetical protein